MTAPAVDGNTTTAPETLATLDLFVLARQAVAARDSRWSRRGFILRARQPQANDIVPVPFPFRNGETDAERLERLASIAAAGSPPAIMPVPTGEAYGLDTLRCFALCRLALPETPHVVADVTTLGPRLAQMAFGFGADALWAPIVAERALRLGANANNPALTRKEAVTLIRGAGLTACERMADGTFQEVTT
jgi:hypothetical protein